MTRKSCSFLLALTLLVGGVSRAPVARAGDEDVKQEKKVVEPVEPEPTPAPAAPDAPDLSVGEEPSPVFTDAPSDLPAPAPAPAKSVTYKPWDPDLNLDYSELMGRVEEAEEGRGVLPPALGFRGYMPNMIAVGAGDRTPGYGALLEYSRNRLGFGGYYSYRPLQGEDLISYSQSFLGVYGMYRWLPFDISPLFLLGLEVSSKANNTFGGIAGFGLDARIYSGWTAYLGYTYHSTVQRGFFGGGFGWSF
jgi:hypothetical protein